jgi:tungstate transport system substrate-binding protein
MPSSRKAIALASAWTLLMASCATDDEPAGPSGDLVLATTTSTQDSGLLDTLIPAFDEGSHCAVKTVAVGSGQAMKMGERGDADVLLVHSQDAEEKFMAAGHGASRAAVMHNDFVVLGPLNDPAGLKGAADGAEALRRIATRKALFASRADESGTHAKELSLWEKTGIEPDASWYLKTGQGMGATLTIASQKQAYTVSDRSTFLATANLELEVAYENSADLRNDYQVIVVKHDGVNTACASEFADWLQDNSTQELIGKFGVDEYGQPLFFADAAK